MQAIRPCTRSLRIVYNHHTNGTKMQVSQHAAEWRYKQLINYLQAGNVGRFEMVVGGVQVYTENRIEHGLLANSELAHNSPPASTSRGVGGEVITPECAGKNESRNTSRKGISYSSGSAKPLKFGLRNITTNQMYAAMPLSLPQWLWQYCCR